MKTKKKLKNIVTPIHTASTSIRSSYPMFWSNPKMYAPRSSSWLVHDTNTFLWCSFGSLSMAIVTLWTAILLFSSIVTVQLVNFSCNKANNFSLILPIGSWSSNLMVEVNLQREKKRKEKSNLKPGEAITPNYLKMCRLMPTSLHTSSKLISDTRLSFIIKMPWMRRIRFGSGGWAL